MFHNKLVQVFKTIIANVFYYVNLTNICTPSITYVTKLGTHFCCHGTEVYQFKVQQMKSAIEKLISIFAAIEKLKKRPIRVQIL